MKPAFGIAELGPYCFGRAYLLTCDCQVTEHAVQMGVNDDGLYFAANVSTDHNFRHWSAWRLALRRVALAWRVLWKGRVVLRHEFHFSSAAQIQNVQDALADALAKRNADEWVLSPVPEGVDATP